ncbi:MAG: type II secretion system F family protein [Bryobacteraceae bacterium]
MAGLISLALFALLALSITWYGYRIYARPGRIFEQVTGNGSVVAAEAMEPQAAAPGFMIRTIRLVGQRVPVSPQEASLARRELMAAGYRSEAALYTYYGLKVILAAVLAVAAFLLRSEITSIGTLRMALVGSAVFVGYFLPTFVLERMVAARQERIRHGLPDALDLLVVSVEAGLRLDQALQNVAEEIGIAHKDLADELSLVALEVRAGKRRADALRNLADRTGEREIRNLVAALVQTDRFGTSLAESLRTHADFMRIQRRQEAEERANKVGVKLVFPIFFCILPSMFIITGGSAMTQIFKNLLPLVRESYMP